MKPLLELPFLSHGHATLKDVEESVRFYREFLGLEVVKTSPRTLVARLGSNTAIVGVTLGEKGLAKANRPWLKNAHFGFDFLTADKVREAHELSLSHQEKFNIQKVGDLLEDDHGLSFMLCDQDGNYWQILENRHRKWNPQARWQRAHCAGPDSVPRGKASSIPWDRLSSFHRSVDQRWVGPLDWQEAPSKVRHCRQLGPNP